MVLFDPSFQATIIHAPGTPQEKRWDARIGGNCDTKALLQVTDRAAVGDEIQCELFDRPRVVLRVRPVVASGQVVYWDALIAPRTEQDGTSGTVSPGTKRNPTSTKSVPPPVESAERNRKGDVTLLKKGDGTFYEAVNFPTAEKYADISPRRRQQLMTDVLKVVGQGQNRRITVESLLAYCPPEEDAK